MKKTLFLIILSIFILGCAEIKTPTPDAIFHPWTAMPQVKLGDTKDDIRSKWGEPDEINSLGKDEFGIEKEEWVYHGRYPNTPIDYKYLSKTKYLYFDGNNLTGYSTGERKKASQ